MRHKEREIDNDRQTDSTTKKQTDRSRMAKRKKDWKKEIHIEREEDKHTDIKTD